MRGDGPLRQAGDEALKATVLQLEPMLTTLGHAIVLQELIQDLAEVKEREMSQGEKGSL